MSSEQAARDFYNGGGGSYPPVTPAPDAAAAPDPFAGLQQAATPAPPTPAQEKLPAAQDAPLSMEEQAEQLYGAQTMGVVDWSEPAAQAADFEFNPPNGMLDTSPAGKDAMVRLREGLAEAGAGKTLATELFNDACRAQQAFLQPGYAAPMSQASAEAELRRTWGPRYEAKVAAAQGLIQRTAKRCPEVVAFLERTGLGNQPDFVRKVAQAAARRR